METPKRFFLGYFDIFTNSEDPDEVPHYAAFHLGPHCLLR